MMSILKTTLRLLPMGCALAIAKADTFGAGANRFEIEFVEIGDPGNPADTSLVIRNGGALPGRVDHDYELGKFEISREIIGKVNAQSGLGITLGDLTDYGGNLPSRPATGISWNEAARFVNWLNASEGFPMAYKFSTQPGNPGFSPLGSDDFFFTYAAKPDWYAPPGWLTPSEILFNWMFPKEPDVGWHRNGIRVAAVVPSVPALALTNLRWSNQAVPADIESTVGNVDVYRASDLDDFGTEPHLADLRPGTGVVIDPEATDRTAFYQLVPHGAPAPSP
jgi:hypothetical protein